MDFDNDDILKMLTNAQSPLRGYMVRYFFLKHFFWNFVIIKMRKGR